MNLRTLLGLGGGAFEFYSSCICSKLYLFFLLLLLTYSFIHSNATDVQDHSMLYRFLLRFSLCQYKHCCLTCLECNRHVSCCSTGGYKAAQEAKATFKIISIQFALYSYLIITGSFSLCLALGAVLVIIHGEMLHMFTPRSWFSWPETPRQWRWCVVSLSPPV